MNTNKFFAIGLIAFSLTLASCGETGTTENANSAPASALAGDVTLKVDVAKSKLNWKGDMLGLYSHNGTINLSEGTMMLKDGKVVNGNFTVDMTSIKPLDNNYGPENTKEALVGHLSSPDFFDVANNPTATFKIASVTGNTAKGTFTLRGKSADETVTDIVVKEENGEVKLTGNLVFNRQNYGAAYATGAAEKVLGDDIQLTMELVGTK